MSKLIKTQLRGSTFWYRSDDRVIGQRIALDKFEKYETGLFLSQLNNNSVVVDVGANIGYYTILAAPQVKKVYAIEPDAECFEILKKNVEENNLTNVVLINKAASNKNEKRYLVKDKNNLGNSRIKSLSAKAASPFEEREKVQTIRLDEVVFEKVEVMKIDVQGWEPQVIEGAKKIIKRDSPVLFLEYTPGEYKNNQMINFLKNNYRYIWSINDFAQVPWPIYKGVKVLGKAGYADLWMKNKMELRDYLVMIKNVNYKKWIKGIINLIWRK